MRRGTMGSMEADARRWDDRYRSADAVTPTAPEVLRGRDDLVASIPTAGRALDVACGLGGATLWLAERGLDVTALDVSAVSIDRVGAAARTRGLAGRVTAVRVDLDDGLPAEPSRVDVVVCQRFRAPRLYGAIADRLEIGGIGIVTVLSTVGASGPTGQFHAAPGELDAAFTQPRLDLLHRHEGGGLASAVFRRLC